MSEVTAAAGDGRSARPAARWVCLMYHDVLPSTDAGGGGAERFAVPLASFERMLDLIRASGRRGCSVAEVAGAGDAVAITFDDGTRSQFDHAVPALRARRMSATFYVTTGWVGRPGYMSWEELRQLRAWGMSVQSHTHTHPFLSELSESDALEELRRSKSLLDEQLQQDTIELGLPGGDAPRGGSSLFARAGYRVVATSRWGVNRLPPTSADVLRLRRCTVRGQTDDSLARRMIEGDAWLALARWPRETMLASLRTALGPTRYARWRRRLLDALVPSSTSAPATPR